MFSGAESDSVDLRALLEKRNVVVRFIEGVEFSGSNLYVFLRNRMWWCAFSGKSSLAVQTLVRCWKGEYGLVVRVLWHKCDRKNNQ